MIKNSKPPNSYKKSTPPTSHFSQIKPKSVLGKPDKDDIPHEGTKRLTRDSGNTSTESFDNENLDGILENITQRNEPKLDKSTFVYGQLAQSVIKKTRAAKLKNPFERHLLELSNKDDDVSILARIVMIGSKANTTSYNGGRNFSFAFSTVDVNNTSIIDNSSIMRGTIFSGDKYSDQQNKKFQLLRNQLRIGAVVALINFSINKTCNVPSAFKKGKLKVNHKAQVSMDVRKPTQNIETINLLEVFSSEEEEMYVRPRDTDTFKIPADVSILDDVKAATDNSTHTSRKKLLEAVRGMLKITEYTPVYFTVASESIFFYVSTNSATDGHRRTCCVCLKNLTTRRRSRTCDVLEFSANPLGNTIVSNYKCLIHLNHFDLIFD